VIESLTSAAVDRRELAFKAAAGLVGGAIGWLPVELTSYDQAGPLPPGALILSYLAMAVLAGTIGGMITAAEAQRIEWTTATQRLFTRGFLICLALAIPENYVANWFFNSIIHADTGSIAYLVLGRVVGWSLMGAMLGAGVGAASYEIPNVLKGALGGSIGGFVGGLGFDLVAGLSGTGLWPRLIGLSAIGLAIGFFIGLVQELTKTAWMTVEFGRLKGRQFRLEGSMITIGRAEENRVGLFGDPSVSPRHAVIERRGDQFTLRSIATQSGSFVNGHRVETAPLHEGDRIAIGGYEMSFHVRTEPGRAANPSPAPQPVSPVSAPTPPQAPTAPTPSPAPFAVAADGPCLARTSGERMRLRSGEPTRIGRALDNDIVIADASVSRHHALIESRNGHHVLRDLGSQNGTWLASRRVEEASLATGDAIRLGDVNLTFYA
jgi:pSer/pThr/pTyr-binding forkhead associated (FHA) protein